jgi:poly(A) polymerase
MLRALRFASTFNLTLEPATADAISTCSVDILEVSNARLFDEVIKLLHNLHAIDIFKAMQQYGLLQFIFPSYNKSAEKYTWFETFFYLALENTVARMKEGKPVTIGYLYAVLLWPELIHRTQLTTQTRINLVQLNSDIQKLLKEQSSITLIAKRHIFVIKDIWEFQIRLNQRNGKKAKWLLQQRRFRAAYDFLLLREDCGELEKGLGNWWHDFQFAKEQEQNAMISQLNQGNPKRNRSKRHTQQKRHDQK